MLTRLTILGVHQAIADVKTITVAIFGFFTACCSAAFVTHSIALAYMLASIAAKVHVMAKREILESCFVELLVTASISVATAAFESRREVIKTAPQIRKA